jgi:hypothetical protein
MMGVRFLHHRGSLALTTHAPYHAPAHAATTYADADWLVRMLTGTHGLSACLASQHCQVQSLIATIGGAEAAVLKSARVDARDGSVVDTAQKAEVLQAKVTRVVESAAVAGKLSVADRSLLHRQMSHQVGDRFCWPPASTD